MFKYLFPNKCCLCQHTISLKLLICPRCFAELPRCHSLICHKGQLRYHALFTYKGAIKKSIHQLKFSHKLIHAKLLGTLLHQCLQNHYDIIPEVIIPIPLHIKRLRERGFNQALEIVKYIRNKRHTQINAFDLIRHRATLPQAQ